MYKQGDILKNIEKLRSELKSIKYPELLDVESFKDGNPLIFLPVLHYSILSYSKYFAQHLLENNYELFSKSDKEFIDKTFFAFINLFNYKPILNSRQFFMSGYAEAKVILCLEVIRIVKSEHNILLKKSYSANVKNNNSNFNKNKSKINDSFRSNKSSKSNKSNISKDERELTQNFTIKKIIKNAPLIDKYDSEEEMDNYIHMASPKFNDDEKITYQRKDISENLEKKKLYDDYVEEQPYKDDFKVNNTIKMPSISKNGVTNMKNEINFGTSAQINKFDFSSFVEIINSLSNSVKEMTNRIDNFKTNIEDRVLKMESEISLIKNKVNILESNCNNYKNFVPNGESVTSKEPVNVSGNSNNESTSNFYIANESNEHIFSFSDDRQRTSVDDINFTSSNNSRAQTTKKDILKKENNDIMNEKPITSKNKKQNDMNYNNTTSHTKPSNFNTINTGIINKLPSKILNEIEDTDSIIQRVANRFKETQRLLNEFK